jgi:hypothetical protein
VLVEGLWAAKRPVTLVQRSVSWVLLEELLTADAPVALATRILERGLGNPGAAIMLVYR